MDYDFKQLHDKEFESLCTDLFSECTGVRFERFKAGKDAGVDARYFTPNNKEVILQCKHWANTPISTLINTLEKAEKPKLERLNPRKYYLAISNPLSRKDKLKIYNALYPHIKLESDIFGKEDLNDLLKANPTIEKRHYKLWLHSTNMLNIVLNSAVTGRSEFEISEITSQSKKYVKTKNHNDAIHILEKLNVAIITGEPGIGKTTLANHICLQYISEGYELVKISADIRDGESVFTKDKKQLFYFDDFLGRNYLDALRGHEGSQITQFMRRVSASKDKKFLLTSRSTILNQGKILCDTFDHNNVQKNEFELKITSLSSKEKAEILYNHIWHSGLPEEFIDEIYKEQRYIKIINHKNFNPRLISHIIDSNRLEEVSKDNYWLHINESLSNPADIWENPFSSQLDDFGRILVLLVVLNGYPITENQLSNAYLKIISQPENQSFSGKRDFQINIKHLTGSFFKRIIEKDKDAKIDIFNPSIGDFILKRYAKDLAMLESGFMSIANSQSLVTIESLEKNNVLKSHECEKICSSILKDICKSSFVNKSSYFIAHLCQLIIKWSSQPDLRNESLITAINFIFDENEESGSDHLYFVAGWAIENEVVSIEKILEKIKQCIPSITENSEIYAFATLFEILSQKGISTRSIKNEIDSHVIKLFINDIYGHLDVHNAFSIFNGENFIETKENFEIEIKAKLEDLGINPSADDLTAIAESIDVFDALNNLRNDLDYAPTKKPIEDSSLDSVFIKDLFERHI